MKLRKVISKLEAVLPDEEMNAFEVPSVDGFRVENAIKDGDGFVCEKGSFFNCHKDHQNLAGDQTRGIFNFFIS